MTKANSFETVKKYDKRWSNNNNHWLYIPYVLPLLLPDCKNCNFLGILHLRSLENKNNHIYGPHDLHWLEHLCLHNSFP